MNTNPRRRVLEAIRSYGAVPVDTAIVEEQQRLADAFFQLKLLPAQVRIADAVPATSVLARA